jgi:hypothetical protein
MFGARVCLATIESYMLLLNILEEMLEILLQVIYDFILCLSYT